MTVTSSLGSSIDQASERSVLSGLLPLVCIVLLGFLAVAAPLPVLSIYVHRDLGFSGFTVGCVIGVQSLVTVVSRHLAGTLCDRHGPRRVVLLGLPMAALAGAFYIASLAPITPTGRLAILVIGRVLLGLGESLFITGTMSWGIGRIGAARTGRVMSLQGIAMYAALGLGAPLGLAAYDATGFASVGALTILMPLVAAVIAMVLPAVVPAAGGDRVAFHRVIGLIWLPGTLLMLATVPFASMAAFLPLDYAAQGWSSAGYAMTAFGIGYVAVRLVGSHLTDKHGAAVVVGISLAIEGCGQVLLWLAPSPTYAVAGAALTGIGFSLIFPAMGVIATRRVPPAQRGRAVGNFIAFFDLALGVTGPVVGLVSGGFGYPSAFLVGLVAIAAAGLMLPGIGRMRTAS
ncbi:MFS transporter [Tardiphaga sp.]|uniref:MFS transporter n=1 Tax=Tardiphaga sp. TaxID=1926292 RepID=UPI0025CECAAA|nr:MFS transporter [Tardiphaga sp.]